MQATKQNYELKSQNSNKCKNPSDHQMLCLNQTAYYYTYNVYLSFKPKIIYHKLEFIN